MRHVFLLFLLLATSPLTCAKSSFEIKRISAQDVFQKYINNKDYILIDNRPEEKFKMGHIQGAINLVFFQENDTQNTLTKENLTKLSKSKKIIFYCTGFDRAPNAANTAIKKWKIPPEQIYIFQGGMMEWASLKYPIVSVSTK